MLLLKKQTVDLDHFYSIVFSISTCTSFKVHLPNSANLAFKTIGCCLQNIDWLLCDLFSRWLFWINLRSVSDPYMFVLFTCVILKNEIWLHVHSLKKNQTPELTQMTTHGFVFNLGFFYSLNVNFESQLELDHLSSIFKWKSDNVWQWLVRRP